MDCIFCKIIKGDIPSFKILEDNDHLAFLTIAPITPGHTLVIPKKHVDYLFDLEEKEFGPLLSFSKKVAKALERSMNPQTGKIGVMVAGLEISHTHIHLIPMNSEGDLNFSKASHNTPKEELQKTSEEIKKVI